MVEGQTSLADDAKVVQEFCDLLESSRQLFNGLRDLPQYGLSHWQPHFAKTFETYTKLWKFQQEKRVVLDRSYDLKRWQIGEIASKIGQLYYHYYLRTSETNYLNEAYQFYSAIRARNYYKNVHKENSSDLMLKKYRFYARFIVVCLLLNYKQDLNELVQDFSRQVLDHKMTSEDEDNNDWEAVVKEIENFLNCDIVEVLNSESYEKCELTMRLLPNSLPYLDKGFQKVVTLGDAIIVGNSPNQVKFSELTIDMYRMVQVLERAPGGSRDHRSSKVHPTQESSDHLAKRENPHKHLLYRPTVLQLLAVLSSAVKEISSTQVLLLYVSARGCGKKSTKKSDSDQGYHAGGVATHDQNMNDDLSATSNNLTNLHCLHPADLYPFTRKPILLIVDSDNARAFDNFPNLFGQPVICLMAPEEFPNSMRDHYIRGRLMTNFLNAPLLSFMLVCGMDQVSDRLYENCSRLLNKVFFQLQKSFVKSSSLDESFRVFFGDDFIRLILLRFAFFYCSLRLHRAYKNNKFYPKCHPILPSDDFFGNAVICKGILDIADELGVRGLFYDKQST